MTFMLQCPAHVIACTRAREKVDFSDPKNPKPLGIQPIAEKNFSYEATVSLMMHDQGARQDVLKCPADLQQIMGRGRGYLTADDGAALRAWVDGAAQIDPKVEHARGMLLNAAEGGVEALSQAWDATPKGVQKALGRAFIESAKASAESFDKLRHTATSSDPDPALDALNQAAKQVQPAAADDAGDVF
jgi:hypothetical protein